MTPSPERLRQPTFGHVEVRKYPTYTSYRAQWKVNGVRQPSRTFDTNDEACDFLDELGLTLRRGGRLVDWKRAGSTFADFANAWYDTLPQRPEDKGTRNKQRSILDSQLIPAFGSRPIGEITRAEIQQWVSGLTGAAESVRNYHSLLGKIMREAQVEGYLPYGLPMGGRLIELPKPDDRAVFLEDREVKHLLKVCRKDDRFRPAYAEVHLTAHTGLRIGELFGLRRTNLIRGKKKDSPYLLVRHGLGGKGTKTRKPRRIDLFDCCVRVLDAQLASHDYDLIFPNGAGKEQNSSNFRERFWKPLVEEAGFADLDLHFHDLRHSHCTSLLARGWDVTTVSERLGHASTKMTYDRYGHAIPGGQRRHMDGMGGKY